MIYNTVFGRIQTGEKATIEDVMTYLKWCGHFEQTVSLFSIKDAQARGIDELFSAELIREAIEEAKNRRKKQIKLQIEELQLELDKLCG